MFKLLYTFIFVIYWYILIFSTFPIRRILLPKIWQEHGTNMLCRKQRVGTTLYQQEPMPHGPMSAPWPPESKCKGGKYLICVALIVPRARLCLHVICKMSAGLLYTFGIHFRTSWTPRVVWIAHRGLRNISTCLGLHFLFLGVLYL